MFKTLGPEWTRRNPVDFQVSNELSLLCSFSPAELCVQLFLFCSHITERELSTCKQMCTHVHTHTHRMWPQKPYFTEKPSQLFVSSHCFGGAGGVVFSFLEENGKKRKSGISVNVITREVHCHHTVPVFWTWSCEKAVCVPDAFCSVLLAVWGCHLLVKIRHSSFSPPGRR